MTNQIIILSIQKKKSFPFYFPLLLFFCFSIFDLIGQKEKEEKEGK